MLIPVFFGLRTLSLFPASVFLFAVQFFVLTLSYPIGKTYDKAFEEVSNNPTFYHEMSYRYAGWLQSNSKDYPETVHRMNDLARGGKESYRVILSQMALRDGNFQRHIASVDGTNNAVFTGKWQKHIHAIEELEKENPIHTWGFKSALEKPYTYFSYQFVHSGFLHFAVNSFFFLLLAPLVELALGASLFLCLYLLGGAFAAFAYSFFQPDSLMPLVGASGSICFLLGFVCVYFCKEKFYYFYWLLPSRGYYGFVRLPAYVALVFWLASDLAGQLGDTGFQSVAHSAHLGGIFIGAIFGAIYYYLMPVSNLQAFFARSKTTT